MKLKLLIDWSKRHYIALLFTIIVLVSIFLRFYDLGTESIWLDEAESIKESELSIQGMVDHTNQPPLYFLFLRGWIHLFGTSEVAIRSLSAIFGILAVILVFLVGSSLLNKRVGLLGSFLASFAYFPVSHSQDARAYSLLFFLSLLSYWLFVEIIKKDNNLAYPAYLVSTSLMVYTHFYGLFVIASQIIYFLLFLKKYPDQKWKYFATIVVLFISLIPFYFLMKNRIFSIASKGFWIPEPGFDSILNTLKVFSGTGSARDAILVLFLLLAILGFFIVKRVQIKITGKKQRKRQEKSAWQIQLDSPAVILFLLLWLFIPILVPFIESKVMTPIYQAKYAIGASPALYLLVAKGLNNIRWQWVFYPVLILIVILSSWGLYSYYKNDVKEQWREVAQLIDSSSRSNDVIVFSEGYYSSPFNYYNKSNLKRAGVNNLQDAQNFVSTEGAAISSNRGRFWLITVYSKDQIWNYFFNTYGKSSIKLAQQYGAITVILFDLSIQSK